jgi:hypothetical protein
VPVNEEAEGAFKPMMIAKTKRHRSVRPSLDNDALNRFEAEPVHDTMLHEANHGSAHNVVAQQWYELSVSVWA